MTEQVQGEVSKTYFTSEEIERFTKAGLLKRMESGTLQVSSVGVMLLEKAAEAAEGKLTYKDILNL